MDSRPASTPALACVITSELLTARTADGVALAITRVPAIGARRGAVLCLHAMMTDARYFGADRTRDAGGFAHALADVGYDVVVGEFRGHGRSARPVSGGWSFDDLVELDVPALVTGAARACGVTIGELTVLGHSLGGLATSAALAVGRIPPVRALWLAAANVWLSAHGRRGAVLSLLSAATRLWGYAPIRAARVGNTDEPRAYIEQLTGWARSGRWTSARSVDYLAELPRVSVPTLAIAGAGDWLCTPRDASAFAGHIAGAAPVLAFGRAYGDAIDPDHFGLITARALWPRWQQIAAASAASYRDFRNTPPASPTA